MLVSLLWLEELLGTKLDIDQIKTDTLSLGIEVEDTKHHAPEHVKIGSIIAAKPHPKRKDLQILDIKTDKKITIVSADLHVKAHDRVLVCAAGSTFQDQTIRTRDFAGIESQGMLVSEQELGLTEQSTRVITLEKGNAGDAFNTCFDDIVLDMSTTPNRPDWLSIDGIARDLAIRLDIDYKKRPAIYDLQNIAQTNKKGSFSLVLQDTNGCPRYTARLFRNITVKDSPFWIKWRLHCMGMNARNNIVDLTNMIMLLTGQPLHPFDHDLLTEGIIVRKARPNEPFVTLEGTEVKLNSDDCVIADKKGPIALAGIIGSKQSEISDKTTCVVLESAYFDPKTIAHTSRRLGIITEASTRFEQGGDIYAVDVISQLTGSWFKKFATAQEYQFISAGKKAKPVTISFSPERLNEILALSLNKTKIKQLLEKNNITITGTDTLTAHIPHYRRDLQIQEDIFEEIARIYGYMNIPETAPERWGGKVFIDPQRRHEITVRNYLTGQGFSEAYNLSLVASNQLAHMGFRDFNILKNPLNERFDALRPTLFMGLIDNVNYNLSKGNKSLKLFEIGNVLLTKEPFQEQHIGIMLGGKRHVNYWQQDEERFDFYDIKGTIENLCQVLHVKDIAYKITTRDGFSQAADILIAGKALGFSGCVAPEYCKESYFYAELSMEKLIQSRSDLCYMTPPKFPANTRDLSFLVDISVAVPDIMASIRKMGGPVLEQVTLFDYYDGKHIPERCKNLGFRLFFRAPDRTLNDQEVDNFVDKIEEGITKSYDAKLRKKE